MKPTAAVELLKAHIKAKTPTFLWGAPGIGKSSVIQQLANDLGIDLVDLRLSQMEPVDLLGLPNIIDGKTHWSTPGVFPTDGKGILFLDEANAAPREVLASAYQLVLDRQLGEYKVPDGWVIVLAGNRQEDHAIVTQMPAPLNNRMAHIDFELSLEDWAIWASKNSIRPEIVSFLRWRPSELHNFSVDHKAWPSPRTWEKVNESLKYSTPNIEYEVVKSLVGEGAATEYLSFVKFYRNLPDIDTIIKDPKKTPVPKEPASKFALSGMLGEHMTTKNIKPLMEFVGRLPKEFQVPTLVGAVNKEDDLMEHPLIIKWVDANSEIFICN